MLKYGWHNSFSTSDFEMAENKIQVYKEVFWVFLHVYKVSHCKIAFDKISCQKRNIYIIIRIFCLQKGSHDTENHCGYLISLASTEIPFCEKRFETKN